MCCLQVRPPAAFRPPSADAAMVPGRDTKWMPSPLHDALSRGPSALTSALPAPTRGAEPSPPSTVKPATSARLRDAGGQGKPIPTPCRSGFRWRTEAVCQPSPSAEQWQLGPTLLEQACRDCVDPASHPFWQAATLLDTLVDHFTVSEGVAAAKVADRFPPGVPAEATSVVSSNVRQTISLSTTVPTTAFQDSVLSLQHLLPLGRSTSLSNETDWLDAHLKPLLGDPALPRAKLALSHNIQQWYGAADRPLPQALHIYTDGSAAVDRHTGVLLGAGAWAFTVWVATAHGLFFLGFAAAPCQEPTSPFYVGEPDGQPLTCELLGLTWCLAWAIEHAEPWAIPVVVFFDCQAAGRGTFAHAQPAKAATTTEGSQLAQFNTYLRQCTEARLRIRSEHVPGHSGDLGNELSDELAKQVRRQCLTQDQLVLPTWPGAVFQHPLRAWAWLVHGHYADLPVLFAFEAEADRMQAHPRPHAQGPGLGYIPGTEAAGALLSHFSLMTYNVLTLLDPGPPGKNQRLVGMRVTAKIFSRSSLRSAPSYCVVSRRPA